MAFTFEMSTIREKGFGHIVVRPRVVSAHHVNLRVHGGQEQEHHPAVPADLSAKVKAASVRQADVADDERKIALLVQAPGLAEGFRAADSIALLFQLQADAAVQTAVVLHQ